MCRYILQQVKCFQKIFRNRICLTIRRYAFMKCAIAEHFSMQKKVFSRLHYVVFSFTSYLQVNKLIF